MAIVDGAGGGQATGAVAAAVVHHDDLEVVRGIAGRRGRLANGLVDVVLLVVAREDDGEAGESRVVHAAKRRPFG